MENKEINREQIKVEKFFKRLYDKSVSKAVSWFLIGILLFCGIWLCMIPAQDVMTEDKFLSWALIFLSAMAAAARVSPYQQYTENQKSRKMMDILKYYPISKKAIWKIKMKHLCIFQAKVTGVGLVIQIVASLIAYKTVTFDNIIYIVFNLFIVCMVGELIGDWLSGRLKEE